MFVHDEVRFATCLLFVFVFILDALLTRLLLLLLLLPFCSACPKGLQWVRDTLREDDDGDTAHEFLGPFGGKKDETKDKAE